MNRLESAELPAFTELAKLMQLSHSIHNERYKIDGRVGDFLSSISSPVSPVVSLVPFCVKDLLIRLREGIDLKPSEQQRLYEITPVFSGFYRYLVDRRLDLQVRIQLQFAF